MIYHILGKSNNMISLLLDTLSYRNGLVEVSVVQNIPVGETPLFRLENSGLRVRTIDGDDWEEGDYKGLLLGVIRVLTKRTVFKAFYESHFILEQEYTTLLHPDASISIQTDIGHGVFISAGVVVAPYVELGNLVTINRNASIGHHTKIGKFSTLNPGCNIAGGSTIGEYTTIGMGANIFDGVNVGSNTIIGAGSLVTEDIPDNVVAYGSPAKVVREI